MFSRCLIYKVHCPPFVAAGFILPHFSSFVKNFFQLFQTFFKPVSRIPSSPLRSLFQVHRAELFYSITSSFICQELFLAFLWLFVSTCRNLRPLIRCLDIIADESRKVNPFFQFISTFFHPQSLVSQLAKYPKIADSPRSRPILGGPLPPKYRPRRPPL